MRLKTEAEDPQLATIAKKLDTCQRTVQRSSYLMAEVVEGATLRRAEEGKAMVGMETRIGMKNRSMMPQLGVTRLTLMTSPVLPHKLGDKKPTMRLKITSKVSNLTVNCWKAVDGARKLLKRMTLVEMLGTMMVPRMTHLPDLRDHTKKEEAMEEAEAEEEEAPEVAVVDQAEPVTSAIKKVTWQESAQIKQMRDHLDKVAAVEVGEPVTNVTKKATLQESAPTLETTKVVVEAEAEVEAEVTTLEDLDLASSASKKVIWQESALMTLETVDPTRDKEGMMVEAPTGERMTIMEEEASGMEERATTSSGTTLQLPQDNGTATRLIITGTRQLNRTMTRSMKKVDGATELYKN